MIQKRWRRSSATSKPTRKRSQKQSQQTLPVDLRSSHSKIQSRRKVLQANAGDPLGALEVPSIRGGPSSPETVHQKVTRQISPGASLSEAIASRRRQREQKDRPPGELRLSSQQKRRGFGRLPGSS